MPKYLETAADLKKEVDALMYLITSDMEVDPAVAAKQIGYIINLAVRCSPRGVQGTVRKNIVATAMKDYCRVWITRETDERTGREFNKIHIEPKEG